MVECGGLENRYRCKPIEGSNPSSSASFFESDVIFLRADFGFSPVVSRYQVSGFLINWPFLPKIEFGNCADFMCIGLA